MEKNAWRGIQFGTLVLWGAGLYLWIEHNWWYLFVILAALHVIEAVTVGPKVGKEHDRSYLISFLTTLVFGFTWWVPLRNGIIE